MSYLKSKDGSIEASIKEMQKNIKDSAYQDMFKKELEKAGKGIGAMTPAEKKAFFNKIDSKYTAKNEAKVDELTSAQKKLPPALQKAIAKKMSDKKEDLVGGQKKLDKDKDGDLDAKDFAMLRKGAKKEMKSMKKEEALAQEPMKKMDSKGTEGGAKKDADMSKVKDAPKAKEGMKAVSGTKQVSENKRYLQTKPGSLEEAVLKTRGLV